MPVRFGTAEIDDIKVGSSQVDRAYMGDTLIWPTLVTTVTDTLYMARPLSTLDRATGIATRVGSANAFGVNEEIATGLAWDGSTLYMIGTTQDALFTLDRATGIATRVGSATRFGVNEEFPNSLAWDGSTLYMLGSTHDALYRVNRTTGIATRVGSANAFGVNEEIPTGLAWDGSTLYMIGSTHDALFTLDRATGIATRVGSANAFGVGELRFGGLTWDGSTLYMLGSTHDALYRVNRTTGIATRVGSATRFGIGVSPPSSLTFVSAVAPAPTFGTATIGTQSWTIADDVDLPIPNSGGGTIPVVYTAAGLPAGLTFNPSPQNLRITGTPAAGTGTATITATDADGRTDTISFGWTVRVIPAGVEATDTTSGGRTTIRFVLFEPAGIASVTSSQATLTAFGITLSASLSGTTGGTTWTGSITGSATAYNQGRIDVTYQTSTGVTKTTSDTWP